MKCLKCGRKMMFLEKVGKESVGWMKKKLEQWGVYKKYRGAVEIYGCWEDESFLVAPTPKQDYFFFSEGRIAKNAIATDKKGGN